MEKYPILQICRTAGFKIDWYIPKPETYCQLSGERRLSIITTYFIWETSRFFTVSFHFSLYFIHNIKWDYAIVLLQNVSCHLFTLQDWLQSVQIGTGTFDHRRISKLSQLQNSRVWDSLISSPPGNLPHVFREMPPCIRKGSCIQRSAQNISLYRYSLSTLLLSFRCRFLHLYH